MTGSLKVRHLSSHKTLHRIVRGWVRRSMERWLRMRGWRVEGRGPSPASSCILIVGPGAEKNGGHAHLVPMALRWLRSPYFYAGTDLSASKLRSTRPDGVARPTTAIVLNTDLDRIPWHIAARESKGRIQVLTIESRHKRIRYHTPFNPSSYKGRDDAYVKRMYSYFT